MISDNINKSLLPFKNALIAAIIIIISYVLVLVFLENEFYLKTIFSDLFFLIIDILVVMVLFYAVTVSGKYGRRMQIAWMFLAVGLLSYTIGDFIYAILELSLNLPPFPSLADVFYLSFYPLFALGIYFLPRIPLSRSEELKLIIDVAIVTITVGLIFWIFLIIPTINIDQEFTGTIISVTYIIGDLVLFFALMRIIFYRFEEIYLGPLILLGGAVIVQVITDSIYYYQLTQGSYLSGGLLDVGWLLGIVLIGLAAVLYVNDMAKPPQKYKFGDWILKFKSSPYLLVIWVMIAYFLLLWASDNLFPSDFIYIGIAVGIIILLVLVRLVITLNENKNLYLAAQSEIDRRKTAENALKKSVTKYKTIFEYTGTAIIIVEEDTIISLANTEFEKLSGYLKEEIENKLSWTKFVTDADLDKMKEFHSLRRNKEGVAPLSYEFQFIDKNKNLKDVFITVTIFPGTKKSLASLLDITNRKKAENDLINTLEEKELLIKEIHHRVKNNLQIIFSMLSLQEAYVDSNPVAISVLKEAQSRVLSIAMVHENLYKSKDLINVNFSEYIKNLISGLIRTYNATQINTVINISNVSLNIESALPCGLIINELVSNSLKYAFKPGEPGEISVNLITEGDNYKLIISDNGIGFPEDLDFRNVKSSLGLKLVNSLVDQLEGTIELDRSQGTIFIIEFKELAYKKRI